MAILVSFWCESIWSKKQTKEIRFLRVVSPYCAPTVLHCTVEEERPREEKRGSGESFHALLNPSHQINSSLDNDPPHRIKDFSESFYTRILQVLLLLLLLWRSGDWWYWVLAMTKTRTRSVFLGVSRIWICISSGTKCSRSDVTEWVSRLDIVSHIIWQISYIYDILWLQGNTVIFYTIFLVKQPCYACGNKI